MIHYLRPKLSQNKKGTSGIFASIILITIFLVISTSLFIGILKQNTLFYQGVSEINEDKVEQTYEQLSFSDVNYTVQGSSVQVEFIVRNDCPLVIQIMTLWVLDTTIQKYGLNDALNINLKPGESIIFTGPTALTVNIEGSSSLHELRSWLVTARGNRLPLESESGREGEIVYANVAGGVGSLMLIFDEFRYFEYEAIQKLKNYPDGNLSVNVPKGTYVAYGCVVKNLDAQRRTIMIDSPSLFWQPGRAGVNEGSWFIVNVCDDGTINATSFTPITLQYEEKRMLVFATKWDMAKGDFDRVRTPQANAVVATFLILHGKAEPNAFAQSIPFVSLYYK